MTVLSVFLSALFGLLYVRERKTNRSYNRELQYLAGRIDALSHTEDNGYVLIPSENAGIRELSVRINRMLAGFYQRKAAYRRAREEMEQMLANLSHDLRTPLTVLQGYGEMLGRETAGGRTPSGERNLRSIEEMTEKISRKAGELAETLDDWFTMAKLESGDMRVELKRINMTKLCHEILLDYYDALEKTQCTVEMEIAGEPVYACADPEGVKRIVKNLIDNALKYGGSGNYLGVRLQRSDAGVTLAVEDHGEGIADKDKERIFTRAYTKAGGSAGSGLGLAIARKLALQMGADLHVHSEPGVRTVFTLLLAEDGVEGFMR